MNVPSIALPILFFLFIGPPAICQDHFNTTLLGRWAEGPSKIIAANGNLLAFNDGAYLVLSNAHDPSAPVELGRIMLEGTIADVHWQGDYIYSVSALQYLEIVFVADPGNPVHLGRVEVPGEPLGVAVQNEFAYLSSGSRGLQIFDVSDPSNPLPVASAPAGGAGPVSIARGHAYVAGASGGLHVTDISNPANPVSRPTVRRGNIREVAISANYLYAASLFDTLFVFDITNPGFPQLAGSYATTDFSSYRNIAVSGGHAYVSGYHSPASGLIVFDLSSPTAPAFVGHTAISNPAGIAIIGSVACVTAHGDGVQLVDVSSPGMPNILGNISGTGSTNSLVLGDNTAFTYFDRMLRVIDITNPSRPHWIHSYETSFSSGFYLAMHNSHLLFPGWGGLHVLDVRDPLNPQPVATAPFAASGRVVRVFANRAYVTCGNSGIWMIDISDITNPVAIANIPVPGWAEDVVVDNDIAFVANYDNGLRILDISDPGNPSSLATFLTGGQAQRLAKFDDTLAVAAERGGLYIFDVSDPQNPIDLCPPFGICAERADGVSLDGGFIYVTDSGNLTVLRLNGQGAPRITGAYRTGGFALDVTARNGRAFVADNDDGMYIIQNDLVSGLDETANASPPTFHLKANFPNPFNGATMISFDLARGDQVSLTIFNGLGQEIRNLTRGWMDAGPHSIQWDGRDEVGNEVSSGIYFCRLKTPTAVATNSLVVQR